MECRGTWPCHALCSTRRNKCCRNAATHHRNPASRCCCSQLAAQASRGPPHNAALLAPGRNSSRRRANPSRFVCLGYSPRRTFCTPLKNMPNSRLLLATYSRLHRYSRNPMNHTRPARCNRLFRPDTLSDHCRSSRYYSWRADTACCRYCTSLSHRRTFDWRRFDRRSHPRRSRCSDTVRRDTGHRPCTARTGRWCMHRCCHTPAHSRRASLGEAEGVSSRSHCTRRPCKDFLRAEGPTGRGRIEKHGRTRRYRT